MIELPLQIDFTGKIVVITGAGGVLCSTMARAFAQAGAKVAALNRSGETIRKMEQECAAENLICKAYDCGSFVAEWYIAVERKMVRT